MVEGGKLNRNTAVKVFDAVFAENGDVAAYVAAHGLEQVRDDGLVEQAIEQVLAENAQSVADYKAGKEKAFGFLVGQSMKALKGKANPQTLNAMLREKLQQG
jgi:aspartyl-tRNA(Asn)/glutamyl-tRNA(Gln) amidotransferase subunit B